MHFYTAYYCSCLMKNFHPKESNYLHRLHFLPDGVHDESKLGLNKSIFNMNDYAETWYTYFNFERNY